MDPCDTARCLQFLLMYMANLLESLLLRALQNYRSKVQFMGKNSSLMETKVIFLKPAVG